MENKFIVLNLLEVFLWIGCYDAICEGTIDLFEPFDPFKLTRDFVAVCDQQDCYQFVSAHLFDQVDDTLLIRGVDVGGWLVSEQQSRFVCQRPRDCDTLLLSDRKLAWAIMHAVRKPDF